MKFDVTLPVKVETVACLHDVQSNHDDYKPASISEKKNSMKYTTGVTHNCVFFCPPIVRKTTQLWVISKFSPFFDNLLEFVRKNLSRAQLTALIFVFKLSTRDITVK